jgi:hypothetical protein
MKGSYMGHLDFDGQRYFDLREMTNYNPEQIDSTETVTAKGKTPL